MIWEILTFLPHWVHLANLESQQAFDFLFENHDVAEQVIKFQDFLYWLPHDILRDRKNKFYLHPLSSAILFRQLRIIHGTRHGQYNAVLLFFNLYHFLPFKDEEPHLWCCFMYKIYCTRFVPFFEQKIQGLFKDTFPIFQGLHSVQKRAWSLCLFYFIHTISNFILKICLCLLLFLGSSP